MLPLFPSSTTLKATFGHNRVVLNDDKPTSTPLRTPRQARTDRFSAWSIADDAQGKAVALSDAAKRELRKATDAAQANAGMIELYSPKYYATS
jgi:solute carrier family 25 phosphate transporter 3